MALNSTPLKPKIGSEIHVSREELLGGALAADIRKLLVERGVIVFRDIELTDEEQRNLARSLGDLRTGTTSKEGDEGLMKITLDPYQNPDYVDFFPGSLLWHIDGTYDEYPPFATILRPITIAEDGGKTEWTNIYAAYDDLSDAESRRSTGWTASTPCWRRWSMRSRLPTSRRSSAG